MRALAAPPLPVFSRQAMDFLSDLSAALRADARVREMADVMSFAFFIRKAHLEGLRAACGDAAERVGRGLCVHIAPGNVAVNFAFSLASGLMAGNANVVRASSRDFAQVDCICENIEKLLQTAHPGMSAYAAVIRYPRERADVTAALCEGCDARVIWGGDATVNTMRAIPTPPRAVDVTFADRASLLMIDAETLLAQSEKELAATALGFYNDTYLTDQNACSSPRLVFWLGGSEDVARAKTRFWAAVHACAAPRYPIEAEMAVSKRAAVCRLAADMDGLVQEPAPDNLVTRLRLPRLTPDIWDVRASGGVFLEYEAEDYAELLPMLSRKVQTLSRVGVDAQALRARLIEAGARGVDRIVPVGHTLDFSTIWDGYDLIATLSRRVTAG